MDWLLVLAYATPVALAAYGEIVSERAGVLNIGLEGCLLSAAFCAMLACHLTGSPWVGLGAGILAATALAALEGVLCIKLGADQVVVGAAANLLALGVTGTAYRAVFGQSGQLVSVPRFPSWGPVDVGIILSILLVPVLAWLLGRTTWGLVLRACGNAPKSVEAAGFSVVRIRLGALLIGGVFAGLAGSYLALGIAGSFAENMTSGRGFVAIALVTFGRWNPLWVGAAAVLVGAAESMGFLMQTRDLGVPYPLWNALPYLLALGVLLVVGRSKGAPTALGQFYRANG